MPENIDYKYIGVCVVLLIIVYYYYLKNKNDIRKKILINEQYVNVVTDMGKYKMKHNEFEKYMKYMKIILTQLSNTTTIECMSVAKFVDDAIDGITAFINLNRNRICDKKYQEFKDEFAKELHLLKTKHLRITITDDGEYDEYKLNYKLLELVHNIDLVLNMVNTHICSTLSGYIDLYPFLILINELSKKKCIKSLGSISYPEGFNCGVESGLDSDLNSYSDSDSESETSDSDNCVPKNGMCSQDTTDSKVRIKKKSFKIKKRPKNINPRNISHHSHTRDREFRAYLPIFNPTYGQKHNTIEHYSVLVPNKLLDKNARDSLI